MRSDCPNDEELGRILDSSIPLDRREVLRRHIAACADCRAVIVEVLKNDLGHESTEVARLPLRAGRYLLGRVLGMGGMGVVYEAEDPQLGRRLAVKVMRTQRGDSVSRETTRDDAKVDRHRQRFVREGQSLARVVHPNVVSVYDVGQADDQLFVAMELVEGGTLRDWMQQGGFSFAQALDMFLAVGRGLLAVHDAGLVHRDLKPENVLLGKDGRPKVTDFGLARQTEESQPELAPDVVALWQGALTQTGALLGTPAYMPLEQLRGQVAGTAADVFAFAVTIWEALYGARPFVGATVDEIESAIRRGRTERTAARTPDTPPRVRRVLQRALALRPHERPSLATLLAQLEALRRPPPWRTPLALAISAVVVAAAVGGTLWGLRRAEEDACRQPIYATALTPDRRARAAQGLARLGPDAIPVSQGLLQYAESLDDRRRASCVQARLDHTLDATRFSAQVACLDRLWDRFDRTLTALGEGPPAPMIGPALARLPVPSRCVDASRAPTSAEAAAARRLAEAATLVAFGEPAVALELARPVGDGSSLAQNAALLAQAQAIQGEALVDLGQRSAGVERLEAAIQTALFAADYVTVAGASLALLERAAPLALAPRRRYELAQQLHWASVRGQLGDPFRAYSHEVVATAHAAGGALLDAEIELRAGLRLLPDALTRRRLQDALDRLLTGRHE